MHALTSARVFACFDVGVCLFVALRCVALRCAPFDSGSVALQSDIHDAVAAANRVNPPLDVRSLLRDASKRGCLVLVLPWLAEMLMMMKRDAVRGLAVSHCPPPHVTALTPPRLCVCVCVGFLSDNLLLGTH